MKSATSPVPENGRAYGALGAATAGAGSALAAVVASSCCVGPAIAPLVVAVLGAGGAAWAAGLQPYSPYLLAGSFVSLVYGLWATYKPLPPCSEEGCPARPGRGVRIVLWGAVVLWSVAVFLNVLVSRG